MNHPSSDSNTPLTAGVSSDNAKEHTSRRDDEIPFSFISNDRTLLLVEQSTSALNGLERLFGVTNSHLAAIKKLSELNNKKLEQAELLITEADGGSAFLENMRLSLDKVRNHNRERAPSLEENVQKLRKSFTCLENLQSSLVCFHSYSESLDRRLSKFSQTFTEVCDNMEQVSVAGNDDLNEDVEETLQDKFLSLRKLHVEKRNLLAVVNQRRTEQKRRKEELYNETKELERSKLSTFEEYERVLKNVHQIEQNLGVTKERLVDLTNQQTVESKRVNEEQHNLDYAKANIRNIIGDAAIYTALLDSNWKGEFYNAHNLGCVMKKMDLEDGGIFQYSANSNTISTAAVTSVKQENASDRTSFCLKRYDEIYYKPKNPADNGMEDRENFFCAENYKCKNVHTADTDHSESQQFKFPQPPLRFRSPVGEDEKEQTVSDRTGEADIEMSAWSINESHDI